MLKLKALGAEADKFGSQNFFFPLSCLHGSWVVVPHAVGIPGGGSPVWIPALFWAINPTLGPVLATLSTGLPSWLPGPGDPDPAGTAWGGAPQAVPLRIVTQVLGQVDDLVGGQHVLALLVVAALALHLVGGHLTFLLVGSIALLVAHGSHLAPHGCTVRAVAVLVIESCLGLGLAAEMFERLCVS